MSQKIFLVIPTIRDLEVLRVWDKQQAFEAVNIIIVEDSSTKTVDIPKIACRSITHYCHADIDLELGDKAWIFPYKTSAVRAYGFYKAWQQGADIVITLDDDCKPYDEDFVTKHVQNLGMKSSQKWAPTYPLRDLSLMRGFPYEIRGENQVVLSHGLWANVPDLDAITQINVNGQTFQAIPPILHFFPKGVYFPMSVMNLAFSREIIPLMYQLLMGEDRHGLEWGFHRFDDIWSGIFVKKILDHLNLVAVSGSPAVWHERASNVYNNLQKEAKGIEVNEILWRVIDEVELTATTPVAAYHELLEKMDWTKLAKYEGYFKTLRKATEVWLEMFSKNS